LNTTSSRVRPQQLTRLRLRFTTNKHQISQHNTVGSQPTTKSQPNITMTRINISYLIALGLLGTAVACKYFSSSATSTANSGNKQPK
jgi:hypothetical protein